MAKYTEAQRKAVEKYRKEKDLINLTVTVSKADRERYKAQAAAHGLSLTAYIVELLERDAKDKDGE